MKRSHKKIIVMVPLVLILAYGIILFVVHRPYNLFRDANGDGLNWFDHHKRIVVLKDLCHKNSQDITATLNIVLAKEYDKIAHYYEGDERKHYYRMALQAMQEAQRLQGEEFQELFLLALYHLQLGEFDEAIAIYLDLQDTLSRALVLARTYELKKEYDQATFWLQHALSISGPSWDIYFRLAKVCEAKGDWQNAVEYYRMGLEDFPPPEKFVETFRGLTGWYRNEKFIKMKDDKDRMEYYDYLHQQYQQGYEQALERKRQIPPDEKQSN